MSTAWTTMSMSRSATRSASSSAVPLRPERGRSRGSIKSVLLPRRSHHQHSRQRFPDEPGAASPGCAGADERPAGLRGDAARYRRGACQGGGGSGQGSGPPSGWAGAAVGSGWSWSRPPAVASSSARCMAPRPPLSSSRIWVRQLNPSARTAAPARLSAAVGSRVRAAQASLTSPWLTWKPKLPARPQQPVSRCRPGPPGQQLLVRVPAGHGVLVAMHLGEHRPPDRRRGVPGGVLGEQPGQGERAVAEPEHAASASIQLSIRSPPGCSTRWPSGAVALGWARAQVVVIDDDLGGVGGDGGCKRGHHPGHRHSPRRRRSAAAASHPASSPAALASVHQFLLASSANDPRTYAPTIDLNVPGLSTRISAPLAHQPTPRCCVHNAPAAA